MMSTRQSCLIVLSSAIEGVSAQSFIQAFNLTHTTFNVQLASPNAKSVEYVHQDDNSRKWLSEFHTKSCAVPVSFKVIDANRYGALLIPHSPGALYDLAHNTELAQIINMFIKENKPICAIGMGVAGLFCARRENNWWALSDYSVTTTSVYELARTSYFGSLPLIPEDYVKDHGGKYSCSEPDAVHVIIDRHLVTGQNEQSTLTAVQNLILMTAHRQNKAAPK